MSWATDIRVDLQALRDRGVPFARAWEHVEKMILVTEAQLSAETVKFIRRSFENGYHRRDVLKGRASILADSADEPRRIIPAVEPAAQDDSLCRFGEPCDQQRAEGSRMCAEHRDRLHAAMGVKVEGFQNRIVADLNDCAEPGCDRFAQSRSPFCARHDPEMAAA